MFGFFTGARDRAIDAALDTELNALLAEATRVLPIEDRRNLDKSLYEIRDAGLETARVNGLSGKQVSRMMKQAGIAQAIAYMEIDRMFSPHTP